MQIWLNQRLTYKTDFPIQIFVPILDCLESSISMGENLCYNNTKPHLRISIFTFLCLRVVVTLFSPILKLLSKHCRRYEGVQKIL